MIIITGASGGVGAYLYRELSSRGQRVAGTCFSNNSDASLHRLDITDYRKCENFAQGLESDGKITLVNCTGITYNCFLHKSEPEKWRAVVETNLIGTYNIIRVLLPRMREDRYGRIINFSSIVAQTPTPGVSAYAATKAAMWGLVKTLAAENAALGVTANNINLGYAALGMGDHVPEEFRTAMLKKSPTGEFCPPEDILGTVEYIINTPHLNGASIDLNGAMI